MPRYIDAEALAEEMGAGCIPIVEKGISGVTGDETCIMDYINNAPTADVEPVRHECWIEEDGGQICSGCGEEHEWGEYRAPYCDTCGAKMDGESEVEDDA